MNLHEGTIHELHDLLVKGETSPQEITHSVFERIDRVEERIHAYITLNRDEAFRQAEEAYRRLKGGEKNPLLGIPVAVKDVICTKGLRTTCASMILENFIPPYDATVIERLRKAGAVILGKTNMDEFAMGSSTEHSAFGVTYNPWNLECISGGSSGGSAAAVAADMCICSLGSDTGGSIRLPAAFCGIVGMKPTYGRVSRYGLVAFASSLDQIGPMTKDVEDCAILMSAVCGHDPRDSTSLQAPNPDYRGALKGDLDGIRIGIPVQYFVEGMQEDVRQAVMEAIKILEDLGARCEEVSLPYTKYALSAYYIIAPAEASSNLARYDGVKYGYRWEEEASLFEMYCETRSRGFGAEVKRRIMLGTYALSAGYYDAYYKKASQVRTLVIQDFMRVFESHELLVAPVAPTTAFKVGERVSDPLQMYLTDICTIPVNLAGLPGISVPCGLDRNGLPIGVQIIGPHLQEDKILKAAYHLERAFPFGKKRPSL